MANFDSVIFELDKDPEPKSSNSDNGTGAGPRKRRGRPPGAGTRKAGIQKELTAELTMFLQLGSAPLMMRDPVCAGAVALNAETIASAMAGILIDHERAIKFLQSGGSMMKYIKLLMALSPVLQTVREHHFAGSGYDDSTSPMANGAPGFLGSMGQG